MVTYNRLELTKQTLNDLVKSVDYPSVLVIVDNGSTDGTVDYLNSEDFKLGGQIQKSHIIFNKENKGIAIGRNQALKYAVDCDAQWLSTLDNDVLLPVGWLSECINILKANRQFAMLGVNVENAPYPIITSNGYRFRECPYPGNLGTACTVFNRNLQKMLGYFEVYPNKLYGLEDTDWSSRQRCLGLKLGVLERYGVHLGVGEHDVGEYREFKTRTHDANVPKYKENWKAYFNKTKPIYVPYRDS